MIHQLFFIDSRWQILSRLDEVFSSNNVEVETKVKDSYAMELEQLMLQIRDGASNLTTENVSMKRLFLVIKI